VRILIAVTVLLGAGVVAHRQSAGDMPASARLAALPEGEAKRQFILDCTGCHVFHDGIAYPDGAPRAQAAWQDAVARMVGNFGAQSGFPVIGAGREPASTARWLVAALPRRSELKWEWQPQFERKADIREFELPESGDLPHDLAIAGREVVITGMFTSRMYVLDPATAAFRTEATPRPNPRAVEVDSRGNWWVVLGGPKLVARRAPSGEWKTFDAGFYAHSVALAPDGGVWLNGHFTHAPELMRRVDPVTGASRDFTVPAHPGFANTPVPYEVRVARDGAVWMSELQGNRIVRYLPASDAFKVWTMPTAVSGPRRLDVAPDGIVWIPEYSANKLANFDPKTEKFVEYELPLRDTAPYIARWDARRNVVWVGTGMADVLFRFDPATRQFTYYRLPTAGSLVRHLAIDPANGDLWLAPGASPNTSSARVTRVRPLD
jgi:streptogramin lyase